MVVRWPRSQIEVELVVMRYLRIDYRSRVHISHPGANVIKFGMKDDDKCGAFILLQALIMLQSSDCSTFSN